jgi:hypothetical protein
VKKTKKFKEINKKELQVAKGTKGMEDTKIRKNPTE